MWLSFPVGEDGDGVVGGGGGGGIIEAEAGCWGGIDFESFVPSAFCSALITASKKTLATMGGYAFPICILAPIGPNWCSSGKDWRQASSRRVKTLFPDGWL